MTLLFSPVQIGRLDLKNRMVMAPLTRSRALHNIPNDTMTEYYGQRAEAGLIITEGTSPSPNGLGYSRIPGIFNADQIKAWARITAAVHDKGGKIFLQLMHTGRVAHPDNLPPGAEVLAPSAVKLQSTRLWTDQQGLQELPVAREMTDTDIQRTVQEFILAAKNSIAAGFDGVEIHAANGYLIKQFLNPTSNRRTDQYGGSIENRMRFLLEVVSGIAQAIGEEKVGIRLSPFGISNETPIYPDAEVLYEKLSKKLNELGILYIHLVDHSFMSGQPVPPSLVDAIRKNFSGTLILSGGYDAVRAEAALQSGKADLIAFGRGFLSNPDLVERFQHQLPLNALRPEFFYSAGAEGYTDYPVFSKAESMQDF
jgi:N-ethylmaleimide reductase